MGSIGSLMSPSARMTAASGIARQLATWPSCARSPSTSWGGTEHPGSACGRVASRPPGTMITCSLFWLADFMRRPCPEDRLVVWKIDRLGRSLREMLDTAHMLQTRGIKLRSLTEQVDTETATGRLMFNFLGTIAEYFLDLNRERTMEGLKAALARGRKGGRRRKLSAADETVARAMLKDPTIRP